MKKTKIVCTIGPKTESEEMLMQMFHAGMDVIRLNFSHGSYDEHSLRINNVNKVMIRTGKKIAIILDTRGPEIRTTKLKNGNEVFLKAGQIFTFTTDKNIIGTNKIVAVTYEGLINDLSIGNIILVDDGMIGMKVIDIKENKIICRVLNNGDLGENKSINLPGISVSVPSLSEKDKQDLIFGCKQRVDFIAASFIRKSDDVKEIRKYLKKYGGENIKIISKIENQEGLNNFNEILEVSDGIMIARGDLGVEIPVEEVIFAQKMIIEKCIYANKIVITATQMLDSMIKNPRPTRAEASDVANAILDGTDAVMLSGESAKGKYPIEAISIMSNICKRTDRVMIDSRRFKFVHDSEQELSTTEAICYAAVNIAANLKSPAIIAFTNYGKTAQIVSKYFPYANILAITTNETTANQLILSKGVMPFLIEKISSIEEFYSIGKELVIKNNLAKKGDILVMIYNKILSNSATTSIHVL